MVAFAKANTPIDWDAIKAFIDGATDKRYIYNEVDTTSGSTVRIQTLLQYNVASTSYIACRVSLSDNIAAGVSAGTALLPVAIGVSTVSPEAAYTAAKAVDMPSM